MHKITATTRWGAPLRVEHLIARRNEIILKAKMLGHENKVNKLFKHLMQDLRYGIDSIRYYHEWNTTYKEISSVSTLLRGTFLGMNQESLKGALEKMRFELENKKTLDRQRFYRRCLKRTPYIRDEHKAIIKAIRMQHPDRVLCMTYEQYKDTFIKLLAQRSDRYQYTRPCDIVFTTHQHVLGRVSFVRVGIVNNRIIFTTQAGEV